MIVTCHMMQYKDCVLAWWFNIGVQIFLCISGYLYGQKNTGEITSFYGKRFMKILVPYYIVFAIAGVLEAFLFREAFNIVRFCAGLVCRTTIAGGEHLWFVPLILFCYVITPILEAYRDKYIHNKKTLCIVSIIAIWAVSIFGGLFSNFFNPAWLSCYVIGYVLGVNEEKKLIKEYLFFVMFGIFTVMGNGIQIYCDYVKHIAFSGYKSIAYQYIKNYNHVCLGILLFLIMKALFGKIGFEKHEKIIKLLTITDKYSYENYLVHQFLILGPFSIMAITPLLPLNIGIILIGIGVLSWSLNTVEHMLMKILL